MKLLNNSGVKTALVIGSAVSVVPLLAMAQSGITQPVAPPTIMFNFQTVINILNTAVTWTFTVFLIVAVIFIIIAAFRYLFSGGDPAGVKKATTAVVYAAVAIAVALLSIAIRFVVQQIVGSPQF